MLDHGLDEFSVAHAGKDDVGVNVCDPPDDERVGFSSVQLSSQEDDAKELRYVLLPQGHTIWFTSRNFV